jgi:PEP-CTERM motif
MTIDFSGLPAGTAVTNQYSGVVFSLQGGTAGPGNPTTGYGWYDSTSSLNNSPNPATSPKAGSGYPTANILDIAFSSGVSGVSFTFNNYGTNSYPNNSNFAAYGPGNTFISSGDLGNVNGFSLVSVTGSGITDLKISNGTLGNSDWMFGVGELTYTSAVPEPSTWAMLLLGFAGVGFMAYRRKSKPELMAA